MADVNEAKDGLVFSSAAEPVEVKVPQDPKKPLNNIKGRERTPDFFYLAARSTYPRIFSPTRLGCN